METLTLSDYEALAELRYQIRRFLSFSEQAARAAGLEPRQHQLLLGLKGLPAKARPTIGELAERLQIQHHSAVELVNRLSAAGYIRRARAGEDRREVLAVAYSQGRESVAQAFVAPPGGVAFGGASASEGSAPGNAGISSFQRYPSEGCRWEEEIIQLTHVEQFCCER